VVKRIVKDRFDSPSETMYRRRHIRAIEDGSQRAQVTVRAGEAALLAAIALLATWLPAVWAARVDPILSIRSE
jgi:hypothetical protein